MNLEGSIMCALLFRNLQVILYGSQTCDYFEANDIRNDISVASYLGSREAE